MNENALKLPSAPLPPSEMSGNPNLEILFGAGVSIILMGFIIYSVYYWKKTRSPIGMLMLLGGVVTCLTEPFADGVGLLWFPVKDVLFDPIIKGFGVGVPWWVVLGYTWYLGGMPFIVYKAIDRGITPKGLAKLAIIIAVADIVLETSGVNMGVYTYYGNQPLELFGMPWWWPINGGISTIGMGTLLYKYRDHLQGLKSLLIIPLIPSLYMTIIAFESWPIWITLNNGSSLLWTNAAALWSIGLTLILFWVFATELRKINAQKNGPAV